LQQSQQSPKKTAATRHATIKRVGIVRSVRKLRRSSPAYNNAIEQANGVCRNCYPEDEDCLLLNEQEMKQLSQIYRKGTFVGLERVSVKNVALDKRSRRNEIVDIVLDLQEEHATVECIRQYCERISTPSKLFAKHIAVAQAA
jgi:hypothetical protein